MRHLIIFLCLLLSNATYAEWKDSVKEGWDKSKDYGVGAWESTKNIWESTNEFFSESEEKRRNSRKNVEEEHFKAIWGSVFEQLEDGLTVVDQIKKAPDSSFFGEDKKSLKEDLNLILDKTLVLLEDESINDYSNKIEELNQKISEAKNNIAKFREEKITAPRDHMLNTTQDNYNKKIEQERLIISRYKNEIKIIKKHFKERLDDIGIDLSTEQVNILLARVDADDIVQMSFTFNVLKKITNQLMQLTHESSEEIKQAKKYYGMHVVLLELVNYMQQKYIDTVHTVYIPKIDKIIANTIDTQNNAKKHIREENDPKRITGFKNNIIALQLTLKTAKLYKTNLNDQILKVLSAQEVVRKDLRLSQNTYDTVEISADLLSVLKTSKNSFDALMSIQVPQIVPFENMQMQKKYQELSKLLK
jgi:hypothetical protein